MNLSRGKLRRLTHRERRYIRARFGPEQMEQTDAYMAAVRKSDGSYPCARATATVTACRMERRLRETPALWEEILRAAGIDDYTLAADLNRMRSARRIEFYHGHQIADVADNNVQMRAVELIAELLGHKRAGSLDVSGTLTVRYEADTDAGFTKRPAEA